MSFPGGNMLRRLFTTPYAPQPAVDSFRARGQTQSTPQAEVTVAVLDAKESDRYFGVALARRGLQPVYIRVTNHSDSLLRLLLLRVDPNYYPPLEAAAVNHFSMVKRFATFGMLGWLLLPLLPLIVLLPLVPLKLITAYRANRRMDDFFREHAFRLHPIAPGKTSEGFVFTSIDAGTKVVHICLHSLSAKLEAPVADQPRANPLGQTIEFTFSLSVPGISADYLRHDFDELQQTQQKVDCDIPTLIKKLNAMPPATTNSRGSRSGDPCNLVVIGEFATILGAFAARWDESETITLATCWKTARSFLLGSQYRYSPVSALYLFGRGQDVALQRSRRSINERLHLRLWLTELRFSGKPVWVGQVSRDIGVRFTTKTWNLTTHRVDPDVDESRDYVIEDLLKAERIDAAAYVGGVGACEATAPRHNLTGDPYFTDGKRAVVLLSEARMTPRFLAW